MPHNDPFFFLAPIYDRVFQRLEVEPLAEAAGLPTEGRLLDVGGGTGRIAQKLAGRAAQVVVVDSSRAMLVQARPKPGLHLAQAGAERLPFAAGSFARVIVVDAYHHMPGQAEALDELWRVLAPGGRLVIEEPDVRHLAVRLVALAERLARMGSRFHAPEAIAAALERRGAHVELQRDGRAARVIAHRPAAGALSPSS